MTVSQMHQTTRLRNYIGWGTSFFDYDNDGKLDLFVVNGSTFQDDKDPTHLVPMKNHLFWQHVQPALL